MRTIVKDHNKKALTRKVFRMAEQGWEPLTKITYDEGGPQYDSSTYYCVMERESKGKKHKFNHPWGA